MNASGFSEGFNKKTNFGDSTEAESRAENENIKRQEINKIIEKYKKGNHHVSTDDEYFSPNNVEDYYGFYYSGEIPAKVEASQSKVKQADQRREKKWQKMIGKKYLTRYSGEGKIPEILIRRLFKGIPEKYRMSVWPFLLDIPSVKEKDVYKRVLDKALASSTYILQIDLDVNRTFRDTTYFHERYGDRQRALFHVLTAYSVFNAEVGYCQGMSDVAGLMLMYISDEEDAFWALSQLISGRKYTMHGMFVHGFPKMHSLFKQLERVLNAHLPKISKHLVQLDLQPSLYAFKWFMQCFLSRVPMSLCLRLWDIYLHEGERVLIAMAYNIFKMHKKKLLKMDYCQVSHFFQNELPKDFLYEDDVVINSLKDCLEELHKSRLDNLPKDGSILYKTSVFNDNNIKISSQNQTNDKVSDFNNTSKCIDNILLDNTSKETSMSHISTSHTIQEEATRSDVNFLSPNIHNTHKSDLSDISQTEETDTIILVNVSGNNSSLVGLPAEENLTMPQFYYKSAVNTKEHIHVETEVKLKILPHHPIISNVSPRSPKHISPRKRNSSASVKIMSASSSKENSLPNLNRMKRISLQDQYLPRDRHPSGENSGVPHYHNYNNMDIKEQDCHNPAYRSVSTTSNNSGGTHYGTRFSLLNNRTSKSVSPPPTTTNNKENRSIKRPDNLGSSNDAYPPVISSQPDTPTGGVNKTSGSTTRSSPLHKSPVNSSPVALNFGVETSL